MSSPPDRPHALLLDDARFDSHAPRGYHPERAERLVAARKGAKTTPISWVPVEPVAATSEQLIRVHTQDYVERLPAAAGVFGYLDPDTYVVPESAHTAFLAAGGVAAVVGQLLAQEEIQAALALVRPPGHHARPGEAMGFCLLNNVAVAAAEARARGVARVAIVDWDVHHGNGTQEIFLRDPSVLYISLHQAPFYPGTGTADEVGEGAGEGFTINIPLEAGGTDGVYRAAFEEIVLPVLAEFAPGLVLVSAGFDAAERDPLAQMELHPSAYGWMATALRNVALAQPRGKIALVLEGGYDLVALEEGVRASATGMVGAWNGEAPAAHSTADIRRAKASAARYWKSLR